MLDYKYNYQFIEASSKESAFKEYYLELYNDIPDSLKDYIDWNKLMQKYKLQNLLIENLGPS